MRTSKHFGTSEENPDRNKMMKLNEPWKEGSYGNIMKYHRLQYFFLSGSVLPICTISPQIRKKISSYSRTSPEIVPIPDLAFRFNNAYKILHRP